MIPFWGKKTEQKQNSATIMISVDGNGLVFPMKLKLQGELFEKIYIKKNILKSIWMLWVLTCFYRSNSCAKHNDSASVFLAKVMWTCKDDVSWASRENWKELSSSAISRETLFNGDSNEETLNLNNTCWQY